MRNKTTELLGEPAVAVQRRFGLLRQLLRKMECAVLGHMHRWSVDDVDEYCRRCGKKL